MKVAIIYSAITIVIWILGMIFDVVGLYISVKYASKDKVKLSKIGYHIMRFGEILERISKEFMMFIPLLFLLEFFKIM